MRRCRAVAVVERRPCSRRRASSRTRGPLLLRGQERSSAVSFFAARRGAARARPRRPAAEGRAALSPTAEGRVAEVGKTRRHHADGAELVRPVLDLEDGGDAGHEDEGERAGDGLDEARGASGQGARRRTAGARGGRTAGDGTITAAHIEKNLEGLSVQKALESNRLYILDHHDRFMPFLIDVNNLDGNFIYATRTLFFLRGDGRLTPLAIELSEPLIQGGLTTAKSKVYTPVPSGSVEGWVWELAKAYVAVNDSGWHQLVSHWLNTHAVMEPFVISTNRHLSVTHPVHKLLSPHYRDTMTINGLARQTLINAGGIFEMTVFPGKFALGMSAVVYKDWNFAEQGLPDDLLKRGVAVADPSSPYKVRLLIEDYPYAADGLAIWDAIEKYVDEYLAIYYPNDGVLRSDVELQAWWKEAREVGHGDLKDAPWWPKMQSVAELAKSCTTIIWIASALHAAVNFGQYPYAGFLPNRPTVSRRRMPEPGTEEYAELGRDPERAFVHTITSQIQTIIGISLLEVLSKHSSDELYLGQRDTPEWTSDPKALEVFKRFSDRLVEIESKVVGMNADPQLMNRNGPAKFPYMLLYPNTSDHKGDAAGLTAKGIPNSISI